MKNSVKYKKLLSQFSWLDVINPAVLLGFLLVMSPMVFAVQSFALSNYQQASVEDFQGWRMSEKFDGVRAIWNGKQLVTRNGHPIAAPEWFIAKLPNFSLDGELWVANQAFARVSSIVLRDIPDKRWQAVRYQIFEVPNQPGGLMQRLAVLQNYLINRPVAFLKVIKQYPIKDQAAVENFYQQVIARGGEGIVVRDGTQHYSTGRLTSAFKYKPVYSAECKVVGYTQGKGQFAGIVGALKCVLLEAQRERLFPKLAQSSKPVIIRLGSGLSHQMRRTPPKIGEIVTFEYSGWTSTGLPRFARFKQIRPVETLKESLD